MLLNLWARTRFLCGCAAHKEPIPLISLMHGEMASQYEFICPKHAPQSVENPEGYEAAEEACTTALSFREAEEVIKTLSKHIEEADIGVADLTGDHFATKHRVDVRVKKYGFQEIHLCIKKV